jgi:hypothetical protein
VSLSVDIVEGLVGFVDQDSDDVGVQVRAHNLKSEELRKWGRLETGRFDAEVDT